MYLVDTNVWLERLLDQEGADEVGIFLDRAQARGLFISDFAFHSICVVLTRLKRLDTLLQFVQESFMEGPVALLHVAPEDTEEISRAIEGFGLDFDDAYQYVAAAKHNLAIVSLDSDFDRTERGRKTPAQVLAG